MKRKNSPIKSIAIFVIPIVLILLVVFGGLAANRLLNTPMAEPLKLRVNAAETTAATLPATDLPRELPTEPGTAEQPAGDQPAANQLSMPVVQAEQATAVPSSAGVCGMEGSLTLLFTGADFSGGVPPNGADAVRVVRYDFGAQTINVVAFPRDLWLNTASLNDPARLQERLGLAYEYKKLAATGSERQKVEAATSAVAQVLYDNFAVLPDHYVTLQLESVVSMVDTIGGVEITLPEAITTERGVTFPAGTQKLDGRLSAEYLRAFAPGGDPARLLRQNRYIEALRAKVMSTGMAAQAPQLIDQFNQAIVTDLTPAQLAGLACAMEKIPAANTYFFQIGGDLVTQQSNGALLPAGDKIDQLLLNAFGMME